MTVQSLTLYHHTRIAVQVIIEDDTGLLLFSVSVLTRLFSLLWQASQAVASGWTACATWLNDLADALAFTGKILIISWKALAFGLGVKL